MKWDLTARLPLGDWVALMMEWVTKNGAGFFDAVSWVLGGLIAGFTWLLLWPPAWAMILATAGVGFWLQRKLSLLVFVLAGLSLIVNMGYWEQTMQTVALVFSATVVCVVIGVPLGIAAARKPALEAAMRPVLDLMQTLPTFVYLIPTLVMFGLGVVPGLISTVIFALPSPIRLTTLGINGVPLDLKEAGQSFGATRWQLLWKIELPHALPTIMAGVTQCIMLSLSMVVIAALVGADGLGVPVVRALNTVDVAKGFEAGLAIVIVAILLDRFCRKPASRKTSPKPQTPSAEAAVTATGAAVGSAANQTTGVA